MNKQKGITMIVLVVTVVVLLILAGISLSVLSGDDGIISKAKEALFKSTIKDYQEQAYLYVTSETGLGNGPEEIKINSRLEEENPNEDFEQEFKTEYNNREFEKIFQKIKVEYTNKVCVYNNEFYYIPIDETKQTMQEVKWCFEIDVKVWGYDNYDDFFSDVNTPKGEYVENNGVYVCEPDLSKFNKETTHYVIYDEAGNETITDSIKTTPEPENWYDYANSKWANVVTISGDMKAYWVWIPRYVYNLDEQANTNKLVNIKFVDINNNYKDFQTKEITNYPDLEPTYDENGYQTNYCLPEAFTWDRGGTTQKELPGYWVSKYEVSTSKLDAEFLFSMDIDSITIEDVYDSKIHIKPSSYDIYLDGEFLENIKSLPYTISGLESNKEYTISAVAKTETGEIIGNIKGEIVKTLEKGAKELTTPDLTGFNTSNTFYVTYNGDAIQSENIPISQAMPSDWFDYKQNRWANILTIDNNDVDNQEIFGDYRSYYVWIPRYEYKVKDAFEQIQIRFISKDQTEPTPGYQIPEAFTFGGTELAGYWVSKYEISDANTNKIEALMVSNQNSITIQSVKIYDSSASSASKYDIYVDDVLKATEVSLPYTITGLSANTQYRVKAVAKTSTGQKIGMVDEDTIKTTQTDIATLTKPDLTGFNVNTTYYLTYDSSGNEIRTPITSAPPSDWYDYTNSKWANIVTSNGGKEAYFVWIPRYEYKVKDNHKQIQIRFITKDVTQATPGYQIPEAFTWDGRQLSGYWVSKYEVSETTP